MLVLLVYNHLNIFYLTLKEREVDSEKKAFGKWWVWILVLLIPTILIFTGLRYAGLVGGTYIERKVFENSFQYSEATKASIATFEAQLAEIDHKLSSDLDDTTRINLEASAAAVRIQLSVARSRQ